jgi:hypothetical protein
MMTDSYKNFPTVLLFIADIDIADQLMTGNLICAESFVCVPVYLAGVFFTYWLKEGKASMQQYTLCLEILLFFCRPSDPKDQ